MFVAVLKIALHLYLCSETAVRYMLLNTISVRSESNILMQMTTYRFADNFPEFQTEKGVCSQGPLTLW